MSWVENVSGRKCSKTNISGQQVYIEFDYQRNPNPTLILISMWPKIEYLGQFVVDIFYLGNLLPGTFATWDILSCKIFSGHPWMSRIIIYKKCIYCSESNWTSNKWLSIDCEIMDIETTWLQCEGSVFLINMFDVAIQCRLNCISGFSVALSVHFVQHQCFFPCQLLCNVLVKSSEQL